MAEFEDTGAALRRLEAALNRIAAQVSKPRPSVAAPLPESAAPVAPAEPPHRHEIEAKLDDLIGGLRSALGIERSSS